MNVIREYNTAKKKKGNVTFGAAHGGKWNFRASDNESGAWTKIMKVPGGREVAIRIAEIISKSWLKSAGDKLSAPQRLDGTARRMIDRLCQVRTLKDWEGEPEWWSNQIPGKPQVEMIYPHQPAPAVLSLPTPISAEDLAEELLPVVELEPEGELVPA